MVSILDQYVAMAVETTYGIAATTVPRGYESNGDGFSREIISIEGGGKRAGRVAMLGNRRRNVDRGGTGSLESVILERSEGLRLEHLLGGSTAPALVAGTAMTYDSVFTADSEGPAGSYTVNVSRLDATGMMRYFQYLGCIPTGFTISVEEGGELMLSIAYDAMSENVLAAAPTAPTYAANGTEMFIFEDCSVMIDGAAVDNFKSFSLDVDLALDTSRYFLQSSADKKKPLRNGVPSFEGSLSGEFKDMTAYNDFVAGGLHTVSLSAISPNSIETVSGTDYYPQFVLNLNACQYNGSSPESTLDAVSMIEVPFSGLSTDAHAVCNIAVRSEDLAF